VIASNIGASRRRPKRIQEATTRLIATAVAIALLASNTDQRLTAFDK